jgi:hypothetical protein
LWCTTSEGGLNAIDIITNEVRETYDINSYINTGEFINAVFEYNNDLILITQYGHILRFNLLNHKINEIANVKTFSTQKIYITKSKLIKNLVWLLTSNLGIFVYDLKACCLVKQINIQTSDPLYLKNTKNYDFLYSLNSPNLFVATSTGISKINMASYQISQWHSNAEIFGSGDNEYSRCLTWYKDKLLIAGAKHLICYDSVLKKGTIIRPVNFAENKQWFKDVQVIYCDTKNIYLGNQTGITLLNTLNNPYVSYGRSTSNYNLTIGHNTHLCSIGDSLVFSCTTEKALYKTNIKSGNIQLVDSSQIYFQAIKLNEHEVLFSGDKRMMLLKENKLDVAVKAYPELNKIVADFIIASIVLNDSITLLASQNANGIYVFNKKAHTVYIINDKSDYGLFIKDLNINNFYPLNKNKVLVVSSGNLTVLDFKRRTSHVYKLTVPGSLSPLKILMDVTKLGELYYFAVYGVGLVVTNDQFEVKKILSANEGILSNGLYKVFNLSDSNLICSSNNGLFIYNVLKNINRKLSELDGLQSNNFEETSGEKSESKIIFGGENGFTIIYPKRITKNTTAPSLYFTKIILLLNNKRQVDSTNLVSGAYTIRNNIVQTNIEFTGINFLNPKNTTFAYRITEQSKEWINIGTRNFISLIGLSPNIYHLQVKAANEDGVWSEPKELVLEFLPKWYQTWWFKLLVLLTAAGIVYAFYRYRIRQIKKQHEIRKNIATDLHDDLGSTLNSVKVFTNLAISGVKQEESLQQVKDNLSEATMSLRDMIWVLDDSLDTLDELVTRLKQFALPITAASNMEFIVTAGSDVNARTLSKEEKRNLFLICKEAINNSIKYSGASQITVEITPAGKKIQITIADNGKGFDEATIKKGYGLKNMQYRAEQIKYTVTMTSSAGKGTQICLRPS